MTIAKKPVKKTKGKPGNFPPRSRAKKVPLAERHQGAIPTILPMEEKAPAPASAHHALAPTHSPVPPKTHAPESHESGMRFSDMKLPPFILQGLNELNYIHPTPIQAETVPIILSGKNVLGQAKTGTGKTAAFGIPIFMHVRSDVRAPQALIVVPTRELALQVRDELENIGKYAHVRVLAVFGGASMNMQAEALHAGPGIIVGTPGRLMDFMRRGTLNLTHVKMAVLDEADKMLDMGFKDDIEMIFSQLPAERQILLFSATMPPEIKSLAKKYLREYREINLSEDTLTVEGITQYYLNVDPRERVTMLLGLIQHFTITKGIVFCSTKRTVDWLARQLHHNGISAGEIHGDLSQVQRQRNLADFEEGKYSLLLATNIAARGIHIEDITHVINFDFPEENETYVHRIGRTARHGKKGVSITFVTNMGQIRQLQDLEAVMNAKVHELKAK
jgi:ATP-dependent RNA helicase DeaD